MFDSSEYGWYTNAVEVASTETGVKEKADLRIPSSQHELVSRCSAVLTTNEFRQEQCKWYRKAPGDCDNVCAYDKWGMMCDKVVIDGKGIN